MTQSIAESARIATVRSVLGTRWRVALARAVGLLGCAALLYLAWQLVFAADSSFDRIGLAIGAAGLTVAWASGQRLVPSGHGLPAVYAGLTLFSTAVHYLGTGPIPPWHPAIHTAVLVLYFYGATRLLASPRRVGALLTVIVVTASILGVQIFYDHALVGLSARPLEYPSVPQWAGYADIGLILGFVLPVPLALTIAARSRSTIVAAAILTLAFTLDIVLDFSRAAYVTLGVTVAVSSALELVRLRSGRLAALALVAVLGAAISVGHPVERIQAVWSGRSFGISEDSIYGSRLIIWRKGADLIRRHPWIGVGPGNYTVVTRANLEYFEPDVYAVHAHNMLLHIAAETGIPAAIIFAVVWYRLLRRLFGACARDQVGMLAIAVFGALVAFFVRCIFDHFLSGFTTSDRIGFLLWTLFAAAAALTRLREHPSSSFAVPTVELSAESAYAQSR